MSGTPGKIGLAVMVVGVVIVAVGAFIRD